MRTCCGYRPKMLGVLLQRVRCGICSTVPGSSESAPDLQPLIFADFNK